MISPLPKWIAVGVALIALASLGLVGSFPMAAATREWITTFSATLASVALAAAIGVWQFGWETSIRDDKEHDRLQMTCAIETQLNVSVLNQPPAEILHARTVQTLAKARLVQLPLSALEELAHSGLEDPAVTSELMWTVAHIRRQNSDVATLLGTQGGVITTASIRTMTEEISGRQRLLKNQLENLLSRLKEAGVEPPPMAQDSGPTGEPFVSADKARGWVRGED